MEFSSGDFGNIMAFWGILYQLNLSSLRLYSRNVLENGGKKVQNQGQNKKKIQTKALACIIPVKSDFDPDFRLKRLLHPSSWLSVGWS